MSDILKLPDVMLITGLKRSSIYRMMTENKFPNSIKLGLKSVAWNKTDVNDWLASNGVVFKQDKENNSLLRNQFAMAALTGLLANQWIQKETHNLQSDSDTRKWNIETAFKFANDAMAFIGEKQ